MASISTLTDTFDGSIDTSKWTESESGSATVTQSGNVVVTPPGSTVGAHYASYTSGTYDLTNSIAYISVSPLNQSTNGQTFLKVIQNSNNYVQWIIENGTIYAQRTVAGVTTTVSSGTYDTDYVYLGLRHSNGRIFWQHSLDGYNWQNYTYNPTPITITAISVEFGAGVYQSEVLPGTAVFDNFNAAPIPTDESTVRNIGHNLQVSWKKESTLGSRTFTIGVSSIGGNDVIGINPGAIGSPANYRYFDESDYVKYLAWERGLAVPSGGLSKAFAEAELVNTSGRFTPRFMGGNSELFTSILPRRPLIINAGFVGETLIPQFSGILDRQPEVDKRSGIARLRAADYVDFFEGRFLDQTVMFTGQRTDEVYETLLQGMGLSTSQYELDTGINIIPFGLFPSGSKFAEVFHKLAQAENGHFYQDASGIYRFENRQHWDSSPFTEVQKILPTSQVLDQKVPSDDHLINVVEVKGTPREKKPNQLVWQSQGFAGTGTNFISANADLEIWINFDDPVLAIDTPVPNGTANQTSFFVANSEEDGTGTDVTSSIYVKAIDKFATTAKITFSNNSSDDAYITNIDIWGRPARRSGDVYYRTQRGASVTAYEERPYMIDNEFIQSISWAESFGEMILQDYSSPENLQEITIRAIPDLSLGDLISWQGKYWRIFEIRSKLSAGEGFLQELTLVQKTITSYFRIGISTIGGTDLIAP